MRILTDDMLIWSDEEEEWRREIEGSEKAAAPEGAPVALPQDGLERHDDNMVGDLANKVSALKNISISIGNDVREQNRLLNEMDSDFDSGKSLSSATTKRRRYVSRTGERPSIHTSFGEKSIIRQRDRPRNVQRRNNSIKENRIGNMSDRPRYVRLRGLPFSSKEHDIIQFLSGCAVTCVSLVLNQEGRPSGDAFVGLKTDEDVEAALAKNKELIQKRYIEVFRISNGELSNAHRRGFVSEEGRLVKLRALPFTNKNINEGNTDCIPADFFFPRHMNHGSQINQYTECPTAPISFSDGKSAIRQAGPRRSMDDHSLERWTMRVCRMFPSCTFKDVSEAFSIDRDLLRAQLLAVSGRSSKSLRPIWCMRREVNRLRTLYD